MSETLNGVEDEFTDIPFNPETWMHDGRMYPPQEDNARCDVLPDVIRYRSRGHNVRIHASGAICIETPRGICLLSKPSSNGHRIT